MIYTYMLLLLTSFTCICKINVLQDLYTNTVENQLKGAIRQSINAYLRKGNKKRPTYPEDLGQPPMGKGPRPIQQPTRGRRS
jgi:hypothetical protein